MGGCEKMLKTKIQKKCERLKIDKQTERKNYNKIEYCLAGGLELLSVLAVLAV